MTGNEIIVECNVVFGQRGVGEIGPDNWLKWINSGILYMSTALCVYEKEEEFLLVPHDEIQITLPSDFVSFVDPWENEGAVMNITTGETLVRIRPQDMPFQHLAGHTSRKVYYSRGARIYLFPSTTLDVSFYVIYFAKAPSIKLTEEPVFDNEAYHFALVDFALSKAFASKVTEGTRMDSAEYHYKKFYQQVVDIKTGKSSKPLTGVDEGK